MKSVYQSPELAYLPIMIGDIIRTSSWHDEKENGVNDCFSLVL